MGWGWSQIVRFLSLRALEDEGNLILVVCCVMAFISSTGNNFMFHSRYDSKHCVTVAFHEEPQSVDPIAGLVLSSSVREGSLHNDNLNLQGFGSSTQQGQMMEISEPEGQASGMPKVGGQASEGQPVGGLMSPERNTADLVCGGMVPPLAGKVIHSTADLYDADGNPDEFWCRVVEEAPNE